MYMMPKLLAIWLFAVIIGIGLGWGVVTMYNYAHPPQKIQKIGDIELLAQHEDGTKVYRVNHQKLIVPLVVVEGKNGQLAIR